jgi:hypothetical protein
MSWRTGWYWSSVDGGDPRYPGTVRLHKAGDNAEGRPGRVGPRETLSDVPLRTSAGARAALSALGRRHQDQVVSWDA